MQKATSVSSVVKTFEILLQLFEAITFRDFRETGPWAFISFMRKKGMNLKRSFA